MVYLRITDDNGERRFDLLDGVITVGRAPENQIIVNDKECSRRQCQIERVESGYKMIDLESRNGTRVNGKYENQHILRPGDSIEIGKCRLTFEDPDHKGPAREAEPAPAAVPITAAPAPAPSLTPSSAPTESQKSGRLGISAKSSSPAINDAVGPPRNLDSSSRAESQIS